MDLVFVIDNSGSMRKNDPKFPNRRYLQQELKRRAARCAREGGKLALLHLDLDRFKQINDTLGHAAGDFVLVRVANILRSATRQNEFVARIGGDEFVVVSNTQETAEGLDRLAARLLEQMDEPVYYEGVPCRYAEVSGLPSPMGVPQQVIWTAI